MNEPPRCSKCGAVLPADAPAGLCPKCLVQAGFESEIAQQPSQEGNDPAVRPTRKSPASAAAGFEPPSPEELGPLFPQLEFLELLGKGGMGAVYKARQRGLDRLVAVKILPPEIGHDAAFAERFTREARALARLSHPHIVAVYDFGQTPSPQPSPQGGEGDLGSPLARLGSGAGGEGSLFYIVMEFVDGANLRQTIEAGGLAPQHALAIVPQICEALQFAHDEGIVHRDIKPENILIDKRGRVKIADFGLAKLVGQDARDHFLTGTHQVMGTLRYMAPEQMQGSREVDHRADIYSLGVVFYELLTGELPMGKFAPPSKKVQVDVRLDEIVLRALEQEPEQRYQHASEVKTDVESISRSAQLPPAVVADASEPRFSRFAIIGAIWAPLFFIAAIAWMITTVSPASEYTGPKWWQLALAFTLLPSGVFAPIGTTILGGMAVGHIRRSGGKVVGLPLAAADVLFFPLLAVFAVIAVPVALALHSLLPFQLIVVAIPGAILASIACFVIGRAAWHVIARPSRPTEATPPVKHESIPQNRKLILLVVAILVLIGISWAVWLEPLAWTHNGSTSFRLGKSLANVHQFGDHVGLAVWIERGEPDGAVYSEHLPGYDGAFRFSGGRSFRYRCVTSDGKHGAVTFDLNGDGSLRDTYQLAAGRLFLVTTHGENPMIRQLNPDLSGIQPGKAGLAEGAAKIKALADTNPAVKQFLKPAVGDPGPASPIPESDFSPGWIMGRDGPVLTDAFAQWVLKLRPDQIASVNAALQDARRDYLALEEQNTERHTDETGHFITTIRLFPGPLAALENRLWSRLDTILDSQQQSVARLNLRLHVKPVQPPIALNEIVAPGFFGWGNEGAQIEIWRVGAWFHWRVSARGYEDSSRAPQLPEPYRRFWMEPATD